MKKFVTKCTLTDKVKVPHEKSQISIETVGDSNVELKEDATTTSTSTTALETTGEGLSKRLSKKNASVNMLAILKEKFEPLLLIASEKMSEEKMRLKTDPAKATSLKSESEQQEKTAECPANKKNRKSKAKNIIKLKKTSPEYGKGSINPISRLMQIQQAKKEREPVFEIISEMSAATANAKSKSNKFKRKQQEFFIRCRIEPLEGASADIQTLVTEGILN
jgi:hypothetical protein